MRELQHYVKNQLKSELEIVKREFTDALPQLKDEEKTILYKYTDDGFYINERLRDKPNGIPEFAKYMDAVLSKLPDYKGVVFRGAKLSKSILNYYQNASESEIPVSEPAYLSCSLFKKTARLYGTVIFEISIKQGKMIQTVSKFGSNSPQNEFEVLLPRGSQINIIDIYEEANYTIIVAEEV